MNPYQYQMMQQMYMMNNPMMMQQQFQQQQMNQMQNLGNKQNQAGKYKTMLCRHFQNGNCQLGNTCHFVHGEADLRTSNDPIPSNIPQINTQKPNQNNFKTQQCKYFEQGKCRNGVSCPYAHGDDLRPSANNNNINMQQNMQGNQQLLQQQLYQIPPEQQKVIQQMQTYKQQYSPKITTTQGVIFFWIIENLKQVFQGNQNSATYLQQASELVLDDFSSKQSEITQKIISVINDPSTSQQQKTQYQQIYEQATNIEPLVKVYLQLA